MPKDALNAPLGEGRPSRRDQIDSRLRSLADMNEALYPLSDMLDRYEGQTAPEGTPVLLLGEWGTGKTHFVCDFALAAIQDGVPAVAALAPTLDGGEPLDELAKQLGVSDSNDLLDQMEQAARVAGRRALILIDAINEGDREAWRRRLPALLQAIAHRNDVALVLTCRTPFEQQIVSARQRKRFRVLYHPGFEDQEFDAQLEFFDFYRLPALHVPLLSTEFARPLFLKLLCEGLVRLSKRTQRRHLDGISSGQKGMTYVLENFVGSIGAEIEARHGLDKMACWYLLKGDVGRGYKGLAGRLADLRQEWLSPADVAAEVGLQLGITSDSAKDLVRDMVSSGLLVEQMRYREGAYVEALALPYQRFSDHLVARHLLATHLDTSTKSRLRRSLYVNRRLGAVFQIDRRGGTFAEPGIASAVMVEFPERIKRAIEPTDPAELLAYLPRSRRLLHPFVDAFVEGLYWRDAGAFGPETERLVGSLLARKDPNISNQVLEVLLGIAARHQHPWNAEWLWRRLSFMSMAPRDLMWSEFLRVSDDTGNPHRLLAWSERSAAKAANVEVTENLLALLALMTTTTERVVRDRATRAMVYLGESNPAALFNLVTRALDFNDPYVAERVLAASYGIALRHWGLVTRHPDFDTSLATLARDLLNCMLAPNAPQITWHALTRSYAEGVVRVLRLLRPRLVTRADQDALERAPLPSESPFRDPALISSSEVIEGESAIHMDFGNYTMGRLVDGRGNYDMKHPEYVDIRKQIADRIGRLGYRVSAFEQADRIIARYSDSRRDGAHTDRYGKKYAWIAYFEMYGLRSRSGLLKNFPRHEPRPTDVDIDPSFPVEPPVWHPPIPDVFSSSPLAHKKWLSEGEIPDYATILSLKSVDGHAGDWVLLDAVIREGVADGRQTQAWVTTTFVPTGSLDAVRAEVAARTPKHRDLPEPGTDSYTFLGEVPWSERFGSDIRRADGRPRRLADRAFDYYANGKWRRGHPVEVTTRTWGWESYHSALNQVGNVMFPSPALAAFDGLRSVSGSADLIDSAGRVVTLFRRDPGPGFGSAYLYVRKDLIDSYTASRSLRLVTIIGGERTLHYDYFDRPLPTDLQELYQSQVNDFVTVLGLS